MIVPAITVCRGDVSIFPEPSVRKIYVPLFCTISFGVLIESLFIRKNGGDKEVIGVGGSGSSGQREMCTFFTAVFYLLGKNTPLPHYLFKQNGFNEFEYVGRKYRTVLTSGFGSNFDLDKRLYREIRNKGFYWK